MASENVEILERNYEAFGRGDLESVLATIGPDFEVGARAVPEAAPDVTGPEALVAIIDQIRDVFGDVRWRPLEFVDLGERVLVRVRIAGTAGDTALPIEQDLGHLYTFKDGPITRLDIYGTWSEARAAAGLEG
jgi:ketosteroid isomerase-like protein